MTQKILFAISGILIVGAIIAVIVTNKPKVSPKLLTVKTEYNYVYTDTKRVTIKIYSNKSKHKTHFIDNINYAFLVNEDESNRFELELLEINYSHSEKYIGDEFYCYNYHFKMPRLETNMLIDNAYLEIQLVDGTNYLLEIGKFQFLYYPNVGEEHVIKILGLYGYKQEGSEFPRLNKIIIETSDLANTTVESISIDGTNDLIYHINQNEIHIEIPFSRVSLFQAPLILTLTKDGTTSIQVIDNFLYFNDYHTLEIGSDLCHIYEVD
ncbi:MAG: hypothetical protein ACOX56_05645 [Acholeplasmataceae bacterium]|jgi:hypothetical protein